MEGEAARLHIFIRDIPAETSEISRGVEYLQYIMYVVMTVINFLFFIFSVIFDFHEKIPSLWDNWNTMLTH